ncbi:hypothetical protein [Flavobacterium lacisediminis]|uniref:Fibronectin type-III domain-containing protein n=1 Tax=Flavobacterium lacisediminis TaxID=2989705 RepID=A0ABT3EJZ0_9FLAO|nr:hypothetical protein [Flavobacterium lacisediminis]MCW1148894.1 hypothetical protein [Flavobacterium lacisediminis]
MKLNLKSAVICFITLLLLVSCSNDSEDTNNQTLPIITTTGVSDITLTSAICGGNIISTEGRSIISKGLVYSVNPNPSINDFVKNIGNGPESFVAYIDNLSPNTTYYIKSFASTNAGTAYGQEVVFRTLGPTPPIVTTNSIENITNNSAIISGNISNSGNSPITSKGLVWSTNPNPTISDNIQTNTENQSFFLTTINNLSRNTQYYVRAFATNILGTSYGNEITFTTSDKYLMFSTTSEISKHVLHNPQDKILYLFTYDNSLSGQSNFKLIAYDYLNNIVLQQKPINPFLVNYITHSLSNYNNQTELYIVSGNNLSILNSSLQEIDNISLASNDNISSVVQKNGLIFISYYNFILSQSKIAVYSRNNLSLISDTVTYNNSPTLNVYNDLSNPNQIKCLNLPQGSNSSLFRIETFNNNGIYLSSNFGTNYLEGNINQTNDNINFIIIGNRGRIYYKNDLNNNSTTLSTDGTLTDYKISLNGSYLYSIQTNPNYFYKILKYNSGNFTIDSLLPINERSPKNLILDNNNFLIIDYDNLESPKRIFLTIY